MALNCLTCQGMKRVDSDKDFRESCGHDKPYFRLSWSMVERSFSGNLGPPGPCNKMKNDQPPLVAAKRVKKGRHRIHNSEPVNFPGSSPRLVRSCGMRRDWSFEDLRQRMDMAR
ncbi:uncharacterized protein LOC132281475 [Cornus florida]|uniref:uncharacterized protein LOC132281475 n=1 Tax=Cornus florida TaxID=4283 RepID=UPI00289EA3EE|nr:uncharacterized protein LOC132281475 [Cornus florida]